MNEILKSPSLYVQGPDLFDQLPLYFKGLGNHPLILISDGGAQRFRARLEASFSSASFSCTFHTFVGECCWEEINQAANHAKATGSDVIVGIGGGKILDTTKAVAYQLHLPVVIVPTAASTDSPCSSLSVIYRPTGEFEQYLFLDHSPNAVLVDTSIIAKAPPSLLAAGMGDAMATWFEARACQKSGSDNQVAGKPTQAALALAHLCWDLLQKNGVAALEAAKQGICTPALENIVETNTYLSGVGFESGGLAAAHAIQKGFSFIPAMHNAPHGCKVAFCTIVQLILEHAPEMELRQVLDFCISVGLPICFTDLGCPDPDLELMRLSAEKACVPSSTIHHLPFPITSKELLAALLKADSIGRSYHASSLSFAES